MTGRRQRSQRDEKIQEDKNRRRRRRRMEGLMRSGKFGGSLRSASLRSDTGSRHRGVGSRTDRMELLTSGGSSRPVVTSNRIISAQHPSISNLSIQVFIHPWIHFSSIHPSIDYPSVHWPLHPFIDLSIYFSVHLFIYTSNNAFVSPSIHPSVCLWSCSSIYTLFFVYFFYPSSHSSICQIIQPSIYLSIHLSIYHPLICYPSIINCSILSV